MRRALIVTCDAAGCTAKALADFAHEKADDAWAILRAAGWRLEGEPGPMGSEVRGAAFCADHAERAVRS